MLNSNYIEFLLKTLSDLRSIFHSEADFQHALAWCFHQQNPNANVRLELPFRTEFSSEYVDLFLDNGTHRLAVELKYKTRKFSLKLSSDEFNLKNQGAQDLGRYDFLADVARLERFVSENRADSGCAILLTNDPSYWSKPKREITVDESFRLTDGRTLEGSLAWLEHAAPGTIRSREKPINLSGTYTAAWKSYSSPSAIPGGDFRFLLWRIGDA